MAESKVNILGDSGKISVGSKYGGSVYCRKVNGVVTVWMPNTLLSGLNANADNGIAQLPVGYRPPTMLLIRDYGDKGYAYINSTGYVGVHPNSSNGYFLICATYIPEQ